jgi:hypothetical protein
MAVNCRIISLAGLLSLGLASTLSATVLVVGSTSEIYSAGSAAPLDSGTLPPGFSFTPAAGQTLTFSSVTGTSSCGAGCASGIGPDGTSIAGYTGTNIGCTSCGLSNIQFIGVQMFLVGVFLDPSTVPSGPNPAQLPAYTASSVLGASFSPGLGQVFFIGDGQGTAGAQTFVIPSGAGRLFLGFADGTPLFGSSGSVAIASAYGDNGSSALTATFAISAVPEPGTRALFVIGLAGVAIGRKKYVA